MSWAQSNLLEHNAQGFVHRWTHHLQHETPPMSGSGLFLSAGLVVLMRCSRDLPFHGQLFGKKHTYTRVYTHTYIYIYIYIGNDLTTVYDWNEYWVVNFEVHAADHNTTIYTPLNCFLFMINLVNLWWQQFYFSYNKNVLKWHYSV